MTTPPASEARANLYRLMDQAAKSHRPILISGKRNNAVLVAEEEHTVKVLRMWTHHAGRQGKTEPASGTRHRASPPFA